MFIQLNQSEFSEQRGAIAFGYANIQAIALPTNSITNAIPFISIGIGTNSVIDPISTPIPSIRNLSDHISNTGINEDWLSISFICVVAVSIDIDAINDINANANIPVKITFILISKYHCLHRLYFWKAYPRHALDFSAGHHKIIFPSLINNSRKQNQERARPLNKLSAIDTILHHQPFYDSLKVKKKQNASPTNHICHASHKCVGQTVFSKHLMIYYEFSYFFTLFTDITPYQLWVYKIYHFFNLFTLKNKIWGVCSLKLTSLQMVVLFWATPLPLTNRGKYRQCNGHIKPGNLCEMNASERGKYIRLGKKEDFGEKEKHWRKKIQTRTWTGKKEINYITGWGDFCPPFKNLQVAVSQRYFSRYYIFPYFSKHSLFSQTYFSPLSFPHAYHMTMVYVLKTTFEKTVMPKIRKLRGMFANAPTIQSTLRRFSFCC